MKTNNIFDSYTAPALEIIEVQAEQGFAGSVDGDYPGGSYNDIDQ